LGFFIDGSPFSATGKECSWLDHTAFRPPRQGTIGEGIDSHLFLWTGGGEGWPQDAWIRNNIF